MAAHGGRAATSRLQQEQMQHRAHCQQSVGVHHNSVAFGSARAISGGVGIEALPSNMRRRTPSGSQLTPSTSPQQDDELEKDSAPSDGSVFSGRSASDEDSDDAAMREVREARAAALSKVHDALTASGLENFQAESVATGGKQTAARTKQSEEAIIGNVLQMIKSSQAGAYCSACTTGNSDDGRCAAWQWLQRSDA